MKGRSSVVLVGAEFARRLLRAVVGTSRRGLRGGSPVVDAACGRKFGCWGRLLFCLYGVGRAWVGRGYTGVEGLDTCVVSGGGA
jgi:hypothetical protein